MKYLQIDNSRFATAATLAKKHKISEYLVLNIVIRNKIEWTETASRKHLVNADQFDAVMGEVVR